MSLAVSPYEPLVPLEPQPHAARRHDWLWVGVPVFMLAYLAASVFLHPGFYTTRMLAQWAPLLVASLGMCILLLARGWVMQLPGRIGRTPLTQFVTGMSGGLVMLITLVVLMGRGGQPDVFEAGEWIFTESIAFLLILGWCKMRSLPARLSHGENAIEALRPGGRDYLVLTKMGLNGLVLFTTFVGFFMAAPNGGFSWGLMIRTLVGTGLVAWGASALNQLIECETDALMRRTAVRPLPAQRMTLQQAIGFGVGLSVAGLALLALTVNILTAAIAALTLAIYLFLYTPLKRINSLSTLAGAICGALPPVMGWTALGRTFDTPALLLFAILFLWQIPHFLAIAWKYREQYAAAGFPMYSVNDARGRATGAQCALYTLALIPISVFTAAFGLSGPIYLVLGSVIGIAYLACAVMFMARPNRTSASRLFFASLFYLPLVLTVMMADHAVFMRFIG